MGIAQPRSCAAEDTPPACKVGHRLMDAGRRALRMCAVEVRGNLRERDERYRRRRLQRDRECPATTAAGTDANPDPGQPGARPRANGRVLRGGSVRGGPQTWLPRSNTTTAAPAIHVCHSRGDQLPGQTRDGAWGVGVPPSGGV